MQLKKRKLSESVFYDSLKLERICSSSRPAPQSASLNCILMRVCFGMASSAAI